MEFGKILTSQWSLRRRDQPAVLLSSEQAKQRRPVLRVAEKPLTFQEIHAAHRGKGDAHGNGMCLLLVGQGLGGGQPVLEEKWRRMCTLRPVRRRVLYSVL